MARPFDSVELIFNPNSTGNARGRAEELHRELAERLPGLPVELRPTEHAGHGREIARAAARDGHPLVVSVSGDGGYNDVVNGLMDAGVDSACAAVSAAGNANDHRRVTRERPLADAIVAGEVSRLDLLRMTVDDGRDPLRALLHRAGHHPDGRARAGDRRQRVDQRGHLDNPDVLRFRPFQIETETGTESFDSVIFANIREMAKYAVLSEEGRPDDGRFEVIILRHTAKWRVLATAVRAALFGLGPQPTAREYRFRTIDPMPVQIDGEVSELERDVRVTVEIMPGVLATIR